MGLFKKQSKQITTIWSTGWADKLNEVIGWVNEHKTDHEKAVDPAKLLLIIKTLDARIEVLEHEMRLIC